MTPFVSASVKNHDPLAGLKDPDSYEIAARLKYISVAEYGYTSGQVEPVVHVITPEKDWIVRNSYGALIWVSRSTVILDIDSDGNDTPCTAAGSILYVLDQFGWNYRLYKTCNGYRVIILDIDAANGVKQHSPFWDAIQSLSVDVNYKNLCHKQRCFRARLSTKPWRTADISTVAKNPIGATGVSIDQDTSITRLLMSKFDVSADDFPALHLHDLMTGGVNYGDDDTVLA